MIVVKPKKKREGVPSVPAPARDSVWEAESLALILERSLENLDSHSHLPSGSLMGFHLDARAARGSPQKICSLLCAHECARRAPLCT